MKRLVLLSLLIGFFFEGFTSVGVTQGTKIQDPVYEGKHASEWISWLDGKGPHSQPFAKDVLEDMGSAAVPQLLKHLKDKDENIRRSIVEILGFWPVINSLDEMQGSEKRILPCLIVALTDPSAKVRRAAGLAICAYARFRRKDANVHVRSITKAFENKDRVVGNLAACAVAMVQLRDNPGLVKRLIKALKEEDEAVQEQALIALEMLGPKAKSALPALHELEKAAEDSDARTWLLITIAKISPTSEETVKLMIKELEVNNPTARKQMALHNDRLACALRSALLATQLGRMGPIAKAAEKPLRQALGDPEARVRVAAARAMTHISPQSTTEMIEVLIGLLKEKDEEVRVESIWAIEELGIKAKKAITPLTDFIKREKNPLIRNHAIVALKKIDPENNLGKEKGHPVKDGK